MKLLVCLLNYFDQNTCWKLVIYFKDLHQILSHVQNDAISCKFKHLNNLVYYSPSIVFFEKMSNKVFWLKNRPFRFFSVSEWWKSFALLFLANLHSVYFPWKQNRKHGYFNLFFLMIDYFVVRFVQFNVMFCFGIIQWSFNMITKNIRRPQLFACQVILSKAYLVIESLNCWYCLKPTIYSNQNA